MKVSAHGAPSPRGLWQLYTQSQLTNSPAARVPHHRDRLSSKAEVGCTQQLMMGARHTGSTRYTPLTGILSKAELGSEERAGPVGRGSWGTALRPHREGLPEAKLVPKRDLYTKKANFTVGNF